MPEPIVLRHAASPSLIVVVRLGAMTLGDSHLTKSCEECHGRFGLWGFSVLEVPGGDYGLLARLRPILAERRALFEASAADLIADGFPVLPTLDHPHWTVVLSAPTPAPFARVRRHFRGPADNPAWAGRGGSVR